MVLSPTAAFGALVLGATSISLGVIAVKQGYAGGSDPQSLNAARLLVAAPCVALALPFLLRAGRPIGVRGALFAIAAGGLIWFASRAELEGLARLPAGMLALLLATAPVWVAAFDWIGLGRVPSRVERITIPAIVAGIAVMAAPVGSDVDLVGVLGGLASAMTFAVFLLVIGRNRRVSSVQAFALGMIGAALTVVITDPTSLTDLPGDLSVPLMLAVGVSSACWALLVGLGIGGTSATTGAAVVAVEPVLVAVLAYVILGEGLSTRQIVGGTIAVGALAVVAANLGVNEGRSPGPEGV